MQIEQHTHDIHAQQAITQVPQITSPDAFRFKAVRQLSEDGLDAIAHQYADNLGYPFEK